MRLDGRSIAVIAGIFALQIAICPAVCLAGSPAASVGSQAASTDESEHAPAHALPPCHKGQAETPQDAPRQGDSEPTCTSCSAEAPLSHVFELASQPPGLSCTSCSAEAPLSHVFELASQPPGLSLVVLLPEIDAAPRGTFFTPFEPDRAPPPAPLFLLKNSFLL